LAEERDRKSSPYLLFIRDEIEDFVPTQGVKRFFDGNRSRFWWEKILAQPSLIVAESLP
jgi:hypothetical protein